MRVPGDACNAPNRMQNLIANLDQVANFQANRAIPWALRHAVSKCLY
jgi:hypothetical protein